MQIKRYLSANLWLSALHDGRLLMGASRPHGTTAARIRVAPGTSVASPLTLAVHDGTSLCQGRTATTVGHLSSIQRYGAARVWCPPLPLPLLHLRRAFSTPSEGGAVDHYVTLGVPPYASAEDIKTAYKKLALQYHPDRNSEPGAEEKFKSIAAAYHVIGHKQRRQQYDLERRLSQQAPPETAHGPSAAWGSPSGSRAYTYQRMTKAEADQLFHDIFGSVSLEDLIRSMEGDRRGRMTTIPSRPATPFASLFGRTQTQSSNTRVYLDAQGNRIEEHTFTSPSGTYYRMSQHSATPEDIHMRGDAERMSSSRGSNGHPFFQRDARGRVGRPYPDSSGADPTGGVDGPSWWRQRTQDDARHSTGSASHEDPFTAFRQSIPREFQYTPQNLSFWKGVWFANWIFLITALFFLILSTLFFHPFLSLSVLLLIMLGKRRRF